MKKKYSIAIFPLILLMAGCGNTSESTTSIIEDVDVVANTKLNLNADLFTKVMQNKSSGDFSTDYCDFNVDGVEKMLTESDYPEGQSSAVFTNYTDGDTTSFTSYNGLYTVKVRYLGIDTPESTSEIEEWGKSASIFNKSRLTAAKHVIVQSAGCAKTGNEAVADIDGYQRSLAYVWYTDVDDPTINDFRNLNLELVQEGYSIFSGSREDMEESFYDAFMQANDIARAYSRHIYSNEKDPNYCYDDPTPLGLDELYNTDYYTNSATYKNGTVKYSAYCDEYTKWTFEGVVSRKNGNAFYIQDTIDGKTYGLYVFTLRSYAPVKIGNRLKVSGVLSFYGGVYELTGVSYTMLGEHQVGDIEYVLDENGNKVTEEVTPIKATMAEIKSGKYDCVLVEIADEKTEDNSLYFGTTWSTFGGVKSSYAYGGEEELNTYNLTHPYYNTNNDMIVFGRWGQKMDNISNFNTLTGDDDYIRVKVPDACRITDANGDTVVSYRYFCGSQDESGNEMYHYYIPKNAQLAYDLTYGNESYDKLSDEQKATIIRKSYKGKKVTSPVGIAQKYVSTSGNSTYSLIVCTNSDFNQISEVE